VTITGDAFVASLARSRFDVFTGVPCSLIEDVIATLEVRARWIAAPREDTAVGLAAGAWLGGRRPAVLMQNSGLGTSLNALASLSLMYGFPALLVVTWRGFGGKDAPEHILTGAITPQVLELLGIPHRVLGTDSLDADLAWAAAEMDRLMQPVAIVVPPGVVETGGVHAGDGAGTSAATAAADFRVGSPRAGRGGTTDGEGRPTDRSRAGATVDAVAPLAPELSRLAALGAARRVLGREPITHANGYICRESFSLGDRPQNFYMIGSMGLASAIGLGVALARPAERSVVFDGDGNLLMNLGVLPLVASLAPANYVHVVFDNEVYGSTGNQRSISGEVRLDRLAAAAGYRTVVAATDADGITAALCDALDRDGPHFVLVKVTREEATVPRIPYTPHELRDRFRAAVLGG
jgi:phosphonopyruvate decarboxylase